ncbi:MAG: DUF370 domain-containing protein [Ruminococcus sp.]|nr:DUF370 domain-containing protein [Ruminococcus sp.]
MYLHLGEKTVVRTDSIVGIFDLENTTVSKHTRDYLANAEKSGRVVNVSYELPKSFVICEENGKTEVYISQISGQTLMKRIKKD